jgi:sugar lactone lactonase YvrE
MRRIVLTVLTTLVVGASLTASPAAADPAGTATGQAGTTSATSTTLFPKLIPLPNGFRPEGITRGSGLSFTFYVGSLADGAIFRGSVLTGRGSVLVPGVAGRAVTGLEVDSRNRLFASGASTGTARVYDAATGAELASYQLAAPGTGFINDVVVTDTAAYFTNSLSPVLYVLPFGSDGRLPTAAEVRTLPLTGDLVFGPGFNTNGIEASDDGQRLIVVQSNTGGLFTVDAGTGVTTRIDLGGATLVNGDGLLRRGPILYAVQNQLNRIAVVLLSSSLRSGRVVKTLTDPALDVPTTVAAFGIFLYAVNARFNTPPTPDTEYQAVRLLAF